MSQRVGLLCNLRTEPAAKDWNAWAVSPDAFQRRAETIDNSILALQAIVGQESNAELSKTVLQQISARTNHLRRARYGQRSSSDTTAIRILNPADGATYSLSAPGLEEPQRIALRAAATADRVHWFVNGALYRTAGPDKQVFLTLRRGRSRIVCADDAGGSRTATIEVE